MRDLGGSKRPWRPTVDQCPQGRSAPISLATPSQTAMAIASAIGVSSARGPTETPETARRLAPLVATVAPTFNLRAMIASASLIEHALVWLAFPRRQPVS